MINPFETYHWSVQYQFAFHSYFLNKRKLREAGQIPPYSVLNIDGSLHFYWLWCTRNYQWVWRVKLTTQAYKFTWKAKRRTGNSLIRENLKSLNSKIIQTSFDDLSVHFKFYFRLRQDHFIVQIYFSTVCPFFSEWIKHDTYIGTVTCCNSILWNNRLNTTTGKIWLCVISIRFPSLYTAEIATAFSPFRLFHN